MYIQVTPSAYSDKLSITWSIAQATTYIRSFVFDSKKQVWFSMVFFYENLEKSVVKWNDLGSKFHSVTKWYSYIWGHWPRVRIDVLFR